MNSNYERRRAGVWALPGVYLHKWLCLTQAVWKSILWTNESINCQIKRKSTMFGKKLILHITERSWSKSRATLQLGAHIKWKQWKQWSSEILSFIWKSSVIRDLPIRLRLSPRLELNPIFWKYNKCWSLIDQKEYSSVGLHLCGSTKFLKVNTSKVNVNVNVLLLWIYRLLVNPYANDCMILWVQQEPKRLYFC